MKMGKRIAQLLLVLSVFFYFSPVFGQARVIILEPDIFLGTTFHGVLLSAIKASQGDQATLLQQFGFTFSRTVPNDTDYYWANYESTATDKGILLIFNDEDDNGSLELTGIRVTGPQTPVVLAGTTIRVGDSMTKLGLNPNAPYQLDKFSWVYQTELGDPMIYVQYDLIQFRINEIGYLGD